MQVAFHEWAHCLAFIRAGATRTDVRSGLIDGHEVFLASSDLDCEQVSPQQRASYTVAGILAERLLELPANARDVGGILSRMWERDRLQFLDTPHGRFDKQRIISDGLQGRFSIADVGVAIFDLAPALHGELQVRDFHSMQLDLDALDHGESIDVLFKTTYQQRTVAA